MAVSGTYFRLVTYARPYWPGFLCAAVSMVFTAATETAFPALLKLLFDKGFNFSTDSQYEIWWVPVIVLGLFFVRGIAGFVTTYAMAWIGQGVLRDLRQAMFNQLLALPASAFDSKSAGSLISRVISEANEVTAAATSVISTIVRDSLILICLIFWLIWINWKLTLIIAVVFPALILVTSLFSRRMREVSGNAFRANSNMIRVVEEIIFGNRIVKIFQGADYEKDRFRTVSSDARGSAMRLAAAQALQTPVSQFIAALGVAAVLTIAIYHVRSGTSTAGDFISFVTAILLTFGPIRHLTDVNMQLQRGLVALESIFSLIDEPKEIDSGTTEISRSKGRIDFDSVSLFYPGRASAALAEISVSIEPGKTVALVGPSGGGKTSFVNLIPRLYQPTSGSIFLDGCPLDDLSLSSLRSQVAIVSQDVILFNDTIFANVTYGSSQKSEKLVWDALESAFLADFIRGLPDRLETKIGDRGVQLSGGQRQRVAIARALIKDAPVLILDEATSALDYESESFVQRAIDFLRSGRTTLIVAHRLETIKNADRILVFDSGKIIEDGTHEFLLKHGELYRRLYMKTGTLLA